MTAIFLGALMIYGITPGPLLIKNSPDLFWGVIASMYIGNIMLLILTTAVSKSDACAFADVGLQDRRSGDLSPPRAIARGWHANSVQQENGDSDHRKQTAVERGTEIFGQGGVN